MRFVKARLDPSSDYGWFLFLDETSMDFAVSLHQSLATTTLRNPNFHKRPLSFAIESRSHVEAAHWLKTRMGWFMNHNGGTSPRVDRIMYTVDASQFPVDGGPEELLATASYTQWPMGTHWYVRLQDGRDVEINGECKFDTEEDAYLATRLFLGLGNDS